MQYKKHPIDRALEALAPILAPSFTLRSYRDKEGTVTKYPLIDYAIAGTTSKVYDASKNQWRSTYLVIFEILVQEKKVKDWCDYTELASAQDKHALFLAMEVIVEQFIVLLTKPKSVSNLIRPLDTIYSDLFFQQEGAITTQNLSGHGIDKLTGIAANFEISCIDSEGGACCLINFNNQDQLDRLRDLMQYGSVSWNLLNQAGGNPPVTACDLIRAQLNDQLLNTCVLPLYDFSNVTTQNALSPTQVSDLQTAFCTPCPPLPVTCPEILAFIAPVRNSCVIPSLVFTAGNDADFNALNGTQTNDLSMRLCAVQDVAASIIFDGVNDNIFAASRPEYDFDGSTPFSFALWLKPSSYVGLRGVFSKRINLGTGYSAIISSGFLVVNLVNTETTNQIQVRWSLGALVANDWHRFLITYDGSKQGNGVNLYIDGVLQAQNALLLNSLTGSIASGTFMAIGRNSVTGSQWFAGKIEDVSVWNIELDQTQATADFNNTSTTPEEMANIVYNMPGGRGAKFGANNIGVMKEISGFNNQSFPYTSLMLSSAIDAGDVPN